MSSEANIIDCQMSAKSRIGQQILTKVWMVIVRQIQSLIESGAFAQSFPEGWPDGNADTNKKALAVQVVAEIPELKWPLQTVLRDESLFYVQPGLFAPDTFVGLD